MDDKRRLEGKVFEIQVVDKHGLATGFGYLSDKEESIEIDGCVVPTAVIEAARRQEPGRSDFVDMEGNQVLPKDL